MNAARRIMWLALATIPAVVALVFAGPASAAEFSNAPVGSTTLPTPAPPKLLSATVSGCEAPCAEGESGQVTLTIQNPTVPEGETIVNTVYANGVAVEPIASKSGNPLTLFISICSGIRQPFQGCRTQQQVDAVRGAEVFTVTAMAVTGNPDDGTQQFSAESAPSNGLVPTQE